MIEAIFIIVLIALTFSMLIPILFSVLCMLVTFLIKLWWVPFLLLLIAYVLKQIDNRK